MKRDWLYLYDLLGTLYEETGNLSSAVAAYRRGLNLIPIRFMGFSSDMTAWKRATILFARSLTNSSLWTVDIAFPKGDFKLFVIGNKVYNFGKVKNLS